MAVDAGQHELIARAGKLLPIPFVHGLDSRETSVGEMVSPTT
jgi:hypothetical protein